MPNSNCTPKSGESPAMAKFNHFISKSLWWVLGIIFTVLTMIYTNTTETIDTRLAKMEESVTFLHVDKVSRQELKQITDELRELNQNSRSEILAQQKSMKEDILSRLDYILKFAPPIYAPKEYQ